MPTDEERMEAEALDRAIAQPKETNHMGWRQRVIVRILLFVARTVASDHPWAYEIEKLGQGIMAAQFCDEKEPDHE